MKKILVCITAMLCMNVYANNTTTTTTTRVITPVGTANPASVYCVERGGKVVMVKSPSGAESGVCVLPNGDRIDEWELYRRDHPAASNN